MSPNPHRVLRAIPPGWSGRVLATGLAATLLVGCSIPLGKRSLSLGYSRTSTGGDQVQTLVPGLDLRLGTAHDGLTLGYSSVLVAGALPDGGTPDPSPPPDPQWTFGWPLSWSRNDGTNIHRIGWALWDRPNPGEGKCRVVAEKHLGLALGMSRQLSGLEFGYGSQTWVVGPTNQSGAWSFSYQSGFVPEARLVELQTKPNTKP